MRGDRARRHDRRRHPARRSEAVLAAVVGRRRRSSWGCTCTTPATPATRTRSPGWKRASGASTPASAGSAAARSRPARPATSPPRTSPGCSSGRGPSTGSTSTPSASRREWLAGAARAARPGPDSPRRPLPGLAYAGVTIAPRSRRASIRCSLEAELPQDRDGVGADRPGGGASGSRRGSRSAGGPPPASASARGARPAPRRSAPAPEVGVGEDVRGVVDGCAHDAFGAEQLVELGGGVLAPAQAPISSSSSSWCSPRAPWVA